PLIRLECFPVSREAVIPTLEVDGSSREIDEIVVAGDAPPSEVVGYETYDGPTIVVPLITIAHGRSGDKGADVNVGVRARHPAFYSVLLRELTESRVATFLAHLGSTSVERFELPGIQAVNFLLSGGLGAGGTASLRFDPQGKAVAQQLLDIDIEIPSRLEGHPALRRS
ncbi:MAG: terpene utilization protein AtuA, partial [Acidimicrobiia bacterium]